MKYLLVWIDTDNRSDHAVFNDELYATSAFNELKLNQHIKIAESMTVEDDGDKIQTIELHRA